MLKKTTLLIFVLAWLSSCSVEHETIKNQQAKSIVKSSLLEGAEAQKVQEKVQSVIRRAPDPFQIGNLHSRSEIPISVDYSRIMQVGDSLGNTTYSMYVKNHPLETNKIFFNVVARPVTDSDLQLKLLKFEKSYLTIYDSETQVGSIKDFSGLVITAPITPETPTDPCPPEDVVSPGGGGYFPGSPDSSTPGNGNQGSGRAGTQQIEQPCEQILLQFLCCHGIHSGESQNCKCKDTDGNIGATYLVDGCAGTITQVYRPLANTESEPSDPCEEAQPPTGVVSPISECQGAFYSSLFMDSPQREFLNSRPDVEAAINGLLFRTDDCQATMELVNWAIEYLQENPDTPVELVLTARYLDCLKVNQLANIFPNAPLENLRKFSNYVRVYGHFFGLNTKENLYHFIAQVGGETDGLLTLNATENLNYTTEARLREIYYKFDTVTNPNAIEDVEPYLENPEGLANLVYCCKNGNGNEASGDGWRYRGRGVLQLTWKSNYEGYSSYLNSIGLGWFYNSPNDISAPNGIHAVLSGMWYFKENVLDKINVNSNTPSKKVTLKVNRGSDEDSIMKKASFLTSAQQHLNCN